MDLEMDSALGLLTAQQNLYRRKNGFSPKIHLALEVRARVGESAGLALGYRRYMSPAA